MPPRMTATAWNQGFRNALMCGILLLVTWLLLAAGIAVLSAGTVRGSLLTSYLGLMAAAFVGYAVVWFIGLRSRGGLVLDCGPHPTRTLFWVNAALMLVLVAIGALIGGPDRPWLRIGGPVFFGVMTLFYASLAAGRLQVREQGLWQYWGLLRWEKIASYHWADDSTLLLRGKGFFSFMRGALPVAAENRQAINDALVGHGVPSAA